MHFDFVTKWFQTSCHDWQEMIWLYQITSYFVFLNNAHFNRDPILTLVELKNLGAFVESKFLGAFVSGLGFKSFQSCCIVNLVFDHFSIDGDWWIFFFKSCSTQLPFSKTRLSTTSEKVLKLIQKTLFITYWLNVIDTRSKLFQSGTNHFGQVQSRLLWTNFYNLNQSKII